jgi:hypothetical protein
MLKRVEVKVSVELPEGSELPELDQIVTIGEFKGKVTAEGKEKQKRRGKATELVHTRKLEVLDDHAAQVLKIEPAPSPLFDEDGEDGDETGEA